MIFIRRQLFFMHKIHRKGTYYMEAYLKQTGGVLYIRLPKEVDHHNAEEIRRKADRILEKGTINKVLFDFAETEFMDSSGVGVIMGRYRQVRYVGGSVSVLHVNSRMDRLLRMSGIYQWIEKKEDES